MTQPPLVLGSSSRYRKELLGRLGVPFTQESPELDEGAFDVDFPSMGADDFAVMLASRKAEALRRKGAGGEETRWLLCADQVGVLERDGERILLRKPETPERCVEQLMALSGHTHRLINGVVLMDEASGERFTRVDVQVMTMRPFERPEAEAYVAACAPLDCAGGYRIEDAGIRLFQSIQSDDFTGIIGLPLLATAELLRTAGVLRP